jgi:SAM-dependent methyltransferase
MDRPNYGNWVSTRLLFVPGTGTLVFAGLAILFRPAIVLAALLGAMFVFFAYARYLLSPRGRDLQGEVYNLVLSNLAWDGKGRAIDIGSGSGPLAVRLARRYPDARVVGVDYWGETQKYWQYSQGICEKNAAIEGVEQRVSFQKASASKLPFEDGSFDAAVSNLTFHEVADARDKRQVVREALRVVKKGGQFSFQDLFLDKRLYGEPEELLATIRSWGVERVDLVRSGDAPCIPRLLKLPFMVGPMAIIAGEK